MCIYWPVKSSFIRISRDQSMCSHRHKSFVNIDSILCTQLKLFELSVEKRIALASHQWYVLSSCLGSWPADIAFVFWSEPLISQFLYLHYSFVPAFAANLKYNNALVGLHVAHHRSNYARVYEAKGLSRIIAGDLPPFGSKIFQLWPTV